MTTHSIISVTDAKKAGMIPLTVDLPEDDPGLEQIIEDMKRVPTVWACVRALPERLAIWRKPIHHVHKDGRLAPDSNTVRVKNFAHKNGITHKEARFRLGIE